MKAANRPLATVVPQLRVGSNKPKLAQERSEFELVMKAPALGVSTANSASADAQQATAGAGTQVPVVPHRGSDPETPQYARSGSAATLANAPAPYWHLQSAPKQFQ